MRKRTKLLVRLLTAVLCVSLLPITVLADNDSPDPESNVDNLRSIYFEGYEGEGYIDVTVSKGKTLELKVLVDADETDGLVYEWDWNYETVEDATTDTYETPEINGCNRVDCRVRDKYDNVLSISATIYYDNNLTVYVDGYEDPNPDHINCTAAPGEEKELKVIASANTPNNITYQWRKWVDSGDDSWILEEIEGATNAAYTTDPIQEKETYSCFVTDTLSGQYKYVDFYIGIDNSLSAYLVNEDNFFTELETEGDYACNAPVGETRTLSVVAEAVDDEGITYQWYWMGDLVEGATSSTYTTPEITSWGNAMCEVTDKYGNVCSITVYFDPVSDFEVSKTTGDGEIVVLLGDDAVLGVEVSGTYTSKTSYQWFLSLGDEEKTPIEGATDSTYTVESVVSAAKYVCQITDGFTGNVWEYYFDVRVDNQFKITMVGRNTHYYNMTVPVGKTKDLSVVASGRNLDGITYSWFVDDEPAEGTTNTFASPALAEDEEVTVKCVAYDMYGNSDEVEFYLRGTNGFEVWTNTTSESRYKTPATGFAVAPNSFVTLSASSEWESDLTYEWSISDGHYATPNGSGYSNVTTIPEATGDTLVVGPITTATYVECVMTNEFGNTNSVRYYIWVKNDFNLSTLPDKVDTYVEMSAEIGSNQDLYAFGMGTAFDEGTQRTWYKNGEVIPGANGGRYTVENIQSSDTYMCFASDEYNNFSHVTYIITVHDEFDAWATASGENYKREEWVYTEQDPVLSVSTNAENPSSVSYEWFYSDKWYETKTLCPDSVNSPEYTVPTGEGAHAYKCYWCKATDQYNNYRWVLFTQVENAYAWMLFEQDSEANMCEVEVARGDSVTLEVVTAPVNDENFSFEWYKGWVDDENLISGETSNAYTVENVLSYCYYNCVVKYNGEVLRTLQFEISCLGAWITGTDHETVSSVDVLRGGSTTLSVTVDDSILSPTYQWYIQDPDDEGYFVSLPIEGATSATYELTNVTNSDDYECRVTDEDGNSYTIFFWVYLDDSETVPAKLLASSLTLDGYLKVNFKFELPDELVNDTGSYILINDTRFLISDAEIKSGYYYFTYSVVSSEIQKAIVLQAYSSNGKEFPLATQSGIDYTDGYSYSILQYLKTIENMSDEKLATYTNKPDELRALVARLGEYGTLAQAYFKDNRSSGYISESELNQVDAVHASTLEGYKATITKSQNCRIKYTGNLSLETATHLNHYFTLEEGRSIDEYEIRVNGDLITTESTGAITLKLVSGNKYCLKIDNIASGDLDKGYNISVVDTVANETMISVEGFSALSYIYVYLQANENDTSKTDIVRVLKSLYLYNQAANGYFG